MKRLSIFLVLVRISINASSQTWAPFPLDETSEWRVTESWLTGDDCWVTEQRSYQISGQQLQGGHEYKVVSYTGTGWSQPTWSPGTQQHCNVAPHAIWGTGGLIRAEDGVYYQPVQNGEVILFDFNLNVGDTLTHVWEQYPIDSTDYVDVNGHSCKRFWVTGDTPEPVWVVEGVGHRYGLFEPIYQFENSGSMCYREHGLNVYGEGACSILSDGAIKETIVLEPFPNPSFGIFRIEMPHPSTYCIYDLFGRIIQEGRLNGASEIDITHQSNGIYLFRLETENGMRTTKLLKQ